MLLNRIVEFTESPVFLFTVIGAILEGSLFLFVLFSLAWVMKKAKSAKKLYILGTSLHITAVFWIFFGPSSPGANAAGLSLFFFGTLIMAIALTEEFITEGVREHVEKARIKKTSN